MGARHRHARRAQVGRDRHRNPRLFLRHFTPDDVDALAEVLCDHDHMRFFPNRFESKDAEEWITPMMESVDGR